jgi:hypothetical protein
MVQVPKRLYIPVVGKNPKKVAKKTIKKSVTRKP